MFNATCSPVTVGTHAFAANMHAPVVALLRRLEDQREALAPAVAHWQAVQQMETEVDATRLQLLTDQQEHGNKLLALQARQVTGCSLAC